MRRHATHGTSTRKSGRIRAILAAGSVIGLGAVITFAAFSDNSNMNTTFTTGTVNISLNDQTTDSTTYTFTKWGSGNLTPGEPIYAALEVKNSGSLPFTYTMSKASLGTNPPALATLLTTGIVTVSTTADCTPAKYDEAAETAKVQSNVAIDALEIKTPRAIDAGKSETLCFKALLPDTPEGNSAQGQTIAPSFAFNATQDTSAS